jgi:hypothetical protein
MKLGEVLGSLDHIKNADGGLTIKISGIFRIFEILARIKFDEFLFWSIMREALSSPEVVFKKILDLDIGTGRYGKIEFCFEKEQELNTKKPLPPMSLIIKIDKDCAQDFIYIFTSAGRSDDATLAFVLTKDFFEQEK